MSGMALVLLDAESAALRLDGQRSENDRRDLATPFVLGAVLMAYEESRYLYADRLARGMGLSSMVRSLFADETQPTYTEMRGFLVGELDARYIDACRAAFWRLEYQNRCRGWHGTATEAWTGHRPRGERGWL